MSNPRKKTTGSGDDEVEQLLRAAQDDVLLKLNVSSHMARGSSAAAIDPDLDRRFQALRKPNRSSPTTNNSKEISQAETKKIADDGGDDDLFARFAALKNSLPSSHSNSQNCSAGGNFSMDPQPTEEEDDEDDEVEKVIKWAIDAARLEPSTLSDDDDDDSEDDDDVDDGGEEKKNKNKNKRKGKKR